MASLYMKDVRHGFAMIRGDLQVFLVKMSVDITAKRNMNLTRL